MGWPANRRAIFFEGFGGVYFTGCPAALRCTHMVVDRSAWSRATRAAMASGVQQAERVCGGLGLDRLNWRVAHLRSTAGVGMLDGCR